VTVLLVSLLNDTFDFTVSELSQYNGGTHEIIVGIQWGADHHKVTCPAKFW